MTGTDTSVSAAGDRATPQGSDMADNDVAQDEQITEGQPVAVEQPGSDAPAASAGDDYKHPDDEEYERLLTEVGGLDEDDTDQAPPAIAPEPAAAKQPADEQPMIPKARLDEALRKASDLAAENELLRQQAARSAPPPPTADQIEQQIIELATRYDEGELSAADWQRQALALQKQLIAAAVPPPVDAFVEAETAKLEEQYAPVLERLTDAQARAIANIVAQERAVLGQDPIGVVDMRRAVCERAAQMFGIPVQTTTSPTATSPLTAKLPPRAQAPDPRLFPPSPATIGTAAQTITATLDHAAVERMSSDQLADLDHAVLDRLMRT